LVANPALGFKPLGFLKVQIGNLYFDFFEIRD